MPTAPIKVDMVKLSRHLRRQLEKTAGMEFQHQDDIDQSARGFTTALKTSGECLARMLVEKSLKGTQWATELVIFMTEGRPAPQLRTDEQDISDDEALIARTTANLNAFTDRFRNAASDGNNNGSSQPAERVSPRSTAARAALAVPAGAIATTPAARQLLDLPEDGAGRPQED